MAAAARPRELITPAEQLERLCRSSPVTAALADCMRVQEVPELVFQYSNDPCTRWHTALKAIGMLPDRIPALPRDIHQILNSKCPIPRKKKESDRTIYKIRETHSLYLIPAGTLNQLEARVRAYGAAHLAEYGEKNLLKFEYFWPEPREEYGDIQFDEPEWILISNDVLPRSRNKSYSKQVRMVEELSSIVLAPYEVPSVKEVAAFYFLHQIATGESILQGGNERNHYRSTFTRVKEIAPGGPLTIGGSGPGGVRVLSSYDNKGNGIMARRKL